MFGKRQHFGPQEDELDVVREGPPRPDPPPPEQLEQHIFDAMDRAALLMIGILEDNRIDTTGRPLYTFQEKMHAFNQGKDWLVRRQKLRPKVEIAAPGIEAIREEIAKEAERQGFLKKPPKLKAGRPSAAVTEARRQAKRDEIAALKQHALNDDSKLRRLLSKGSTGDDE